MSPLLMTAAILLVAIGLAHSVLGERFLIAPLLADRNMKIFNKAPLAKNILRFAWHITTVAWWGMAVAVWDLSGKTAVNSLTVYGFVAAFVVTGVMILAWTRGKHVAWIVFFAIAGCLWAGV
ncbi:MAG: hypothetical protein JEZ02_11130 [Desulfatibacillum sp.]|nr:hypothetical protein [Desulfatibacillum sp.]